MDEQEPQANRIVWWIVGAFFTILVAGGSAWMNHVAAQVDELRTEQKVDAQDRATIRERTTKLETKLDMIVESTRETTVELKQLRGDIQRAIEAPKGTR